MVRFSFFLFASFGVTLLSCSNKDNDEDLTNTVNKNGAVESSVTVAPLDSLRNVLTTTHKVWVHNSLYKTIEYRDTVPSLGNENTTAENADGDTKSVTVKKEYEIYITVK